MTGPVSESGAAAQRERPRVLLVEDDPGVRNATRIFLKTEGFEVIATASLAEAVQNASGSPDIDLIISDYHLGASPTGAATIAAIRAQLARPIGAILVTGDTLALTPEMLSDPNLRIIGKPIDADTLLTLMHELLGR
jgi:CheY-like chemotaxis protein